MGATTVGILRILLEANASKLDAEFGKASVTVDRFDKFSANAGRKLQQSFDQFSGQRLVAEATRMVAAVEKVGGVSALTERELQRLSATVAEATAKMRAMGADIPPSIAKVSQELAVLKQKADASRELEALQARLKGVSDQGSGFAATMRKIAESADKTADRLKNIGSQASSLGMALSKTLTLPLVAVAGAAIKTGQDFEKVLNSIQGVLDRKSVV